VVDGDNEPSDPIDALGASIVNGVVSSWEVLTPPPAARSYFGVVGYGGNLYVIGGQDRAGTPLDTTLAVPLANTAPVQPVSSLEGLYSQRVDLGAVNSILRVKVEGSPTAQGTVGFQYWRSSGGFYLARQDLGVLPLGQAFVLPDLLATPFRYQLALSNASASDAARDVTRVTVDAFAQATQLVFESPVQTIDVSSCSAAITLGLEDPSGDPALLTAPINVPLTSTSVTGSFFSDPACTTPFVSGQVQPADRTLTVYYRDTSPGTVMLAAQPTSVAGGQQTLNVRLGTLFLSVGCACQTGAVGTGWSWGALLCIIALRSSRTHRRCSGKSHPAQHQCQCNERH
jgi:hypothetical protein